ncbi:MAG: class I SAM-dependent methyltransferase [Anaerolineales bacterium]|nr:class I SAM-dependent methyltransferase [Anaerolineales bacterium]
MSEFRLFLKPGREKSIRQKHPWIFSGAVDKTTGDPDPGETVEVYDSRGKWLARAGYSPHSQIAARIWTWDPGQAVDADFFRQLILQASELRKPLKEYTDGYRLVHAENDGLPGVIVDRYGAFLVVQFLSAAADRWKSTLTMLLSRLEGVEGVYERSDADVREKEHLPAFAGLLHGDEPPERITIREGGWHFLVDIREGHKTGFYLDQRDNRRILHDLVSTFIHNGNVLNVFSYTGAFAVAAYSAGAIHVLNVDSSQAALEAIRDQFSVNGLTDAPQAFQAGNAFEVLRAFRDQKRQFDVVILDPPKFASSQKDLYKAARAYKDINWLATRITRPGGLLLTFSCSGLVGEDLFQKIVFSATLDAGRDAQILNRLGQPMDHPIRLTFPEGQYLKGLACRIL